MDETLTDQAIRAKFRDAGDFIPRTLQCGAQTVYAYMIDGLISGGDASELVLKPLARMRGDDLAALYRQAKNGTIYNNVAEECADLDTVVSKLVNGYCVVLFPGVGAVAFEVKTPEKRGISPPTVENTTKGPKDAFTETVRTNTSLLRRHLRTADLRLYQTTVGSTTLTNVTVAWIDGVAKPELVERMKKRLSRIRTEHFLTPAEVEEQVTGRRRTPFPLMQYTERADKFAMGLLSGRVGLMVDGLPLGYLLPVDLGYLMTSPEDDGMDYLSAACIRVLRYGAMLISLLLPACYIALAMFHQQMIPQSLLRAIIESKESVPFSTAGEVLALLLAFELLQEAGIHLPQSIGQSVSIIGGIVVGTAAVEASLVSPAALIAVSLAGICGFALPNRDFAEALRLCRFLFTVLGTLAGLFGVTLGLIGLVLHLAGLSSLDEAYLAPFSQGKKPAFLPKRVTREKRGKG